MRIHPDLQLLALRLALPHAAYSAADQQHRERRGRAEASRGESRFARDQLVARMRSHDVHVEVRQQMHCLRMRWLGPVRAGDRHPPLAALDIDLDQARRFGEQAPREGLLEREPPGKLGDRRRPVCAQELLEHVSAGLVRILLAPAGPVRKAHERRAAALPRSVAQPAGGGRPAEGQRPVRIVAGPGLIAGRRPFADARLQLALQLRPVDRFRADHLGNRVDQTVQVLYVHAEPHVPLPLRVEPQPVRGHPRRDLSGREEMQGPAQADGLDQRPPAPQRIADVLARDATHPHPEHELGARRHLRVHAADVGDDLHHSVGRRRLEQMVPPKAASDHLRPRELFQRGSTSRLCTLRPIRPRRSYRAPSATPTPFGSSHVRASTITHSSTGCRCR